MFQFRFN